MSTESRQQRSEIALDVIEAAIELDFEVDAAADTELPIGLRDPIKSFARGCELLEQGLPFHSVELPDTAALDDDEFRMAARNGGVIAEHIVARMHAERERIEAQMALKFDESR
jgi:hypothetical protein